MKFAQPIIDEIETIINKLVGNEEENNNTEPFLNQFDFNQTCLLLTIIFVIVFMYKKEIMNMLNLK